MRPRFFFLLLLVASSVVGAQEKDASLMTYDEYSKTRHSSPYVVELEIRKGALLYFGAQHTNDPKSQQIAQIEKLWGQFRPTVAFNEGGDPPVLKNVDEAVSRVGEAEGLALNACRPVRPDQIRSLHKSSFAAVERVS